MTHSGGKPHAVGDQGQRFEVSFVNPLGGRQVFGWSATMRGAKAMRDALRKHPAWTDPQIRDRQASP